MKKIGTSFNHIRLRRLEQISAVLKYKSRDGGVRRQITVFLWIVFSLVILSHRSFAAENQAFSFDSGLEGWSIWGEGQGRHVPGVGHHRRGALGLSANKGQEVTAYRELNLPPGRYKVSAWLRALDVQPGQWNYSIWLFYQTTGEIVSPVTNLKGTFEWSEASYTIDVANRPVGLWFRLKSPGRLWIDDIRVESYSGPVQSFSFNKSNSPFPRVNTIGEGVRCSDCYRWIEKASEYCPICGEKLHLEDNKPIRSDLPPQRMLLDFEEGDRQLEYRRHNLREFNNKDATSGQRSAVITFGKYNNLNVVDQNMKDWNGYDYLVMDVYNPLSEQVTFAVCINDKDGGGYWDQLNHYSTLATGWNRLKFHVKRYVGERGSVQIKRYLDLGSINKVWFAVAPEDKREIRTEFLVDAIRLEKAPSVTPPSTEIRTFDFVKDAFRTQSGFTGIETRHTYSADVGFGFVDAEIWRSHDSIYADTLHRDGIFINKGIFRVDVPNGKYVVHLVPYALGEWYEHFWTKRIIKVQGKTVLSERRHTTSEYLADYLRFSDIEPRPSDTAYDLYLKKIFQAVEYEVEVTNGRIEIDCEGDDSAIMLNSLIIYPVAWKKEGERFVAEVDAVLKDEFENLSRKIEPQVQNDAGAITAADRDRGIYTALIDTDVPLRYNQVLKSKGHAIELFGGPGQRPAQALLVRNLKQDGHLVITATNLRNAKGQELTVTPSTIRYGVAQFQGHSSNHETYELAPRFLRDLPSGGIPIPSEYSLLIWYQIPLDETVLPGVYGGSLSITLHGNRIDYPVSTRVDADKLPQVDIAVGFFGLDPVSFDYFQGEGVRDYLRKNRLKVLKVLAERGFTTWSSLPKANFKRQGEGWVLQAEEIDDLMREARRLGFTHKVFTYGGGFPVKLDVYKDVDGVPHDHYRGETSTLLEEHMREKKWLPVVFDISDEAAGYSQNVERDLKRAAMLKEFFPYLRLGGYTHPIAAGQPGAILNDQLTDITLSSTNDAYLQILEKRGQKWGQYKQASGLSSNPKELFSKQLMELRGRGGDHFLAWHLTLSQNYPYYDLDGRESDAMMLYPRRDGGFDFAIQFEQATLGIQDYRNMLKFQK